MYLRHPAALRDAPQVIGHVGPVLAAVAGELNVAVVGPNPKRISFDRAGIDRRNGRKILGARGVNRQSAAQMLPLLLRVVGRQVRGNDFPAVASICAFVDELAAEVDRLVNERIGGDGGVPVEAQLHILRVLRLQKISMTGNQIDARDISLLRHREGVSGIAGIDHHIKSVAEEELLIIRIADAPVAPDISRPLPGTVVLHAAVNVVRIIQIHTDMVVLGDRQILDKPPGLPPVV